MPKAKAMLVYNYPAAVETPSIKNPPNNHTWSGNLALKVVFSWYITEIWRPAPVAPLFALNTPVCAAQRLPVHCGAIRFGPLRSGLVRFDPVRSALIQLGPLQSGLVCFDPVWSASIRLGPLRSG